MAKTFDNRPWIKSIIPEIILPSLSDNTADIDRLVKGVKSALRVDRVSVDFSLVKRLPNVLDRYNYQVRAILYENNGVWHLIDIIPLDNGDSLYALAIDLGSSTVVFRLIDISKNEIKDEIISFVLIGQAFYFLFEPDNQD